MRTIHIPADTTPMEAIKALRELLGCNLTEAKEILSKSPRWLIYQVAHDEMIDLLEKHLEEDDE